ncbi:MAG: fimbria major subunit, partial [Muribaculaceae bacterium]|nr:fimbria major subunit [Muribaculaceae bacterium]
NVLKGMGYRIITPAAAAGDNTEINSINCDTLTRSNEVTAENDGNRTYLNLPTLTGNQYFGIATGAVDADKNPVYDRVEATDLQKVLKTTCAISYWNSGLCYYYVPVNHYIDNGTETSAIPGVVRNHVYKININGISGFGTPVFDPTVDIIPTKPIYDDSDLVYLSAQVNVLKWRVSSQDVILE